MNSTNEQQPGMAGQQLQPGDNQVQFGDKTVKLSLSARALQALNSMELQTHIDVELELYFSCLIRKRVNIRERAQSDAVMNASVNENLSISFRPVMTKVCRVSDVVGEPDTERLPIINPARFTPNWVSLDYKNRQWTGDFGF
jgi:hypothetical protein